MPVVAKRDGAPATAADGLDGQGAGDGANEDTSEEEDKVGLTPHDDATGPDGATEIPLSGVTPEVLAALTGDEDDDLSEVDYELTPPVIDVSEVAASQSESADMPSSLRPNDGVPAAPGAAASASGAPFRSGTPSGDSAMVGVSALGVYLHELRGHSLLGRDEEHELAVRFSKTGDSAAARRLITSNLRLVVKISQEYRRAHKNLLDLIQEGNVGLIQAVQKYDPYRGVKLSSYAAWWIRAYILKFILANWRIVKIGTTQAQRKLFFNLRKEREKLEKAGFEVEARHLAAALDVSEREVLEMERRLGSSETSLDSPIRGDETGGRTQGDVVPASPATRPDVQVEVGEFQELLRQKLEVFGASLKDRELDIFRERLLNDSPATLQEIGEKYGVSRERARQIEERLKKRLRVFLQTQLGDAVKVTN